MPFVYSTPALDVFLYQQFIRLYDFRLNASRFSVIHDTVIRADQKLFCLIRFQAPGVVLNLPNGT